MQIPSQTKGDAALATLAVAQPPAVNAFVPLTEFTLFPELPVELRLEIWEFSLEARVLQLTEKRPRTPQEEFILKSDKPLSIMQVNTESREVGKRSYDFLEYYNREIKGIFVNWELDTIYAEEDVFKYQSLVGNVYLERISSKMRRLAILCVDNQRTSEINTIVDTASSLTNIRNLTFYNPGGANYKIFRIKLQIENIRQDKELWGRTPVLDHELPQLYEELCTIASSLSRRPLKKYNTPPRFIGVSWKGVAPIDKANKRVESAVAIQMTEDISPW
ncbi:uncharacterized protein LY89DRAFT_770526 [Mollisia scopiformis]|uniref:2EXR domain-containing protein n=1 Tax=Mollisia scopiformis TaxID=149040 RepID=A0A194XNE7_MOLSC|nr:uncharacterized protein LY89DRAFT_770526 [Mollisia scopiformis]KUJ21277.1 hypothetical protein LY89DRAFT_770526 [Mollisia scopiformis]